MSERFLGLDIGGANVKYCCSDGLSGSVPFELWKYPDQLTEVLKNLPGWESAGHLGITMTGELADCFQNKADGVARICESVLSASSESQSVEFYQTTGLFVDANHARTNWQLTAAANWHGLAKFIGLVVPGCIVVDVGSTTTDLIPVRDGEPVTKGNTDLTRLANGELLYTGVTRSPVCSIVRTVSIDGHELPVAQELFSNLLDVYLILGNIKESSSSRHTADGRPADQLHAFRRLARMLCCDESELTSEQVCSMAQQVAKEHQTLLRKAIKQICSRELDCANVVLTGEGAFLADSIIRDFLKPNRIYRASDVAKLFGANARLSAIETAGAIMHLLEIHKKGSTQSGH